MKVDEPANFREAAIGTNWKKVMKQDIESIEDNKIWELTIFPPGKMKIGLKWIYKLKKDTEGRIIKHKARLVAKGYIQEYGVDFDEVYALVTRLEIVRLRLALAAKNSWEVHIWMSKRRSSMER
ncbi:putative mitochondrial protein AtMg00820 [Apium graveolens]|uniref:putative mitochondrial protein AtMg00820 n=1 Tax=Apium graveolens TaxID=4045 RepID=UPI003D7A886E